MLGLLQDDMHNLALGFAILACGAGVGRLCYWRLWERGRKVEMKQSEMKLNE
jgi:hypothetical protein